MVTIRMKETVFFPQRKKRARKERYAQGQPKKTSEYPHLPGNVNDLLEGKVAVMLDVLDLLPGIGKKDCDQRTLSFLRLNFSVQWAPSLHSKNRKILTWL